MLTTGNSSRHADYWQQQQACWLLATQQTCWLLATAADYLLCWLVGMARKIYYATWIHTLKSWPVFRSTLLTNLPSNVSNQLKYIICLLLFIFTRLCLLLIMLCPHGCGWDFYLWLRALWFTLTLLSAWNFGVSWFWQFFRNKKTNKKHHLVFKTTTHPQPHAPPFLCVCFV